MSTQNEIDDSSSIPVTNLVNSNQTDSSLNQVDDGNPQSSIFPSNNSTEQSHEQNDDEKPITIASHSRRVHFPTDDSQLRLVSYSPDPLANQPLVSLGVILQRYRATCQRLQIRQLSSLLDQLNTMDDGRKSCFDRLDCLKITNEKIDIRHIDAIEEILSRCRFHTLDLQSSTIDDAALAQLFDVIEYYESCTHLNLSSNRPIGFQGYQALTKYIRKTNSLQRLDMNAIRFDDSSILSFTRSLRLSTTLYELHVESCQLNGKLLQKFIQNIRSCVRLRELYLCDNRLQVQDSLLINELIRTCGQYLFLLDLRSNTLQDGGMSHLASQLSQYDENHTRENTLHKLSLEANHLTKQGVGFIAKALLHNRTLRSLNLSQNNITNEGLFFLRDALLTNRTINELILRNCHLTDQAAIALAEFIAESSTIQYIDLRDNNIQASGVCGLAIAMKNNRSLLKLDFDPIVATPTNIGLLSTNSSTNRTANTNSLLSMSNIRRMTTGFGSFSGTTALNANRVGGGGTRELLEQKARWMNDIEAVCQRNILIYEEKLRLEEEEDEQNKQTNHPDSNGVKLDNPETDECFADSATLNENESSAVIDEENLESFIQNQNAHISESTKYIEQPNHTSVDDTNEIDNSLDTSINNNEKVEQLSVTSDGNDDAAQYSTVRSVDPTTDVEQINIAFNDDLCEIEEVLSNLIERVVNAENQDQSDSNMINQSSLTTKSLTVSDPSDDIHNDNKRYLRHSDSISLLRKKVKNENDD